MNLKMGSNSRDTTIANDTTTKKTTPNARVELLRTAAIISILLKMARVNVLSKAFLKCIGYVFPYIYGVSFNLHTVIYGYDWDRYITSDTQLFLSLILFIELPY